jgi:hypothetical protein
VAFTQRAPKIISAESFTLDTFGIDGGPRMSSCSKSHEQLQ